MKPILQVEDDINDVYFLNHAMKAAGVANPIQVAADGQEAIDYLRGADKFADRKEFPLPCLVLLDLKLPYVMGLDVLKWIRQEHGMSLVVVMLTASGQRGDMETAYRLGANGYLIKPTESSILEDMSRAIKDFWLTHNKIPPESHSRRETLAPARALTPFTVVESAHPTNGAVREGWPDNIKADE